MDKKAYAFFKKKRPKKSNPVARALKFFTPQVIKDKTKYNRKQDGRIWKRKIWGWTGD